MNLTTCILNKWHKCVQCSAEFQILTLDASHLLNLPDSTRVFSNQLSLPAVSNCELHLITGRSIFSIISPRPLTPVKSTAWQVSFKKFRPLAQMWTQVAPHVRKPQCSRTLIKDPSIIFSCRLQFFSLLSGSSV